MVTLTQDMSTTAELRDRADGGGGGSETCMGVSGMTQPGGEILTKTAAAEGEVRFSRKKAPGGGRRLLEYQSARIQHDCQTKKCSGDCAQPGAQSTINTHLRR